MTRTIGIEVDPADLEKMLVDSWKPSDNLIGSLFMIRTLDSLLREKTKEQIVDIITILSTSDGYSSTHIDRDVKIGLRLIWKSSLIKLTKSFLEKSFYNTPGTVAKEKLAHRVALALCENRETRVWGRSFENSKGQSSIPDKKALIRIMEDDKEYTLANKYKEVVLK